MAIQKLRVEINVNGRDYVRDVEPRYLLADFLRHELGLKGTHIGCEHGVCGACTVMIDGRTARSCLHFAVDVAGAKITTVESLGSETELDHAGKAAGCKEALFTLGDKPELRYPAARRALDEMGFKTTVEYLAHVGAGALENREHFQSPWILFGASAVRRRLGITEKVVRKAACTRQR